MSLKYTLLENLLTARNDDYVAQTQNVKSHNLESIIDRMVKKGNTLTRVDILAAVNSFIEEIEDICRDGEAINTDLFNTNYSIQGVFEGATDSFDAKRHSLKLNLNAGKRLREALTQVSLVKSQSNEVSPHIFEVRDSVSKSVNDIITSRGVLEISGNRLKVEGDDTVNGVVLVGQDGKPNKILTYVENKPGRLIVMLPKLSAGEYTLQVITQHSGGTLLKSPRTGTFGKVLTVL